MRKQLVRLAESDQETLPFQGQSGSGGALWTTPAMPAPDVACLTLRQSWQVPSYCSWLHAPNFEASFSYQDSLNLFIKLFCLKNLEWVLLLMKRSTIRTKLDKPHLTSMGKGDVMSLLQIWTSP